MSKFEKYIEDLAKAYEDIPKNIVNALIEKDAINMFGKKWHQMYQYSTNTYGHFESAIYDLSKTVKKNLLKKELDWIFYKKNREIYSKELANKFIHEELKKEYVQLILNPVYEEDM